VTLHARAVETLTNWQPPDHDQDSLRHAFLSYLAVRADACLRECVPAHLTASMLLLDAAGEHVLLTLHPRVGRWLQLGGHCEPDDFTLPDTALRETFEESGVSEVQTNRIPLCLAVYMAAGSAGASILHLDVTYLGFISERVAPRPEYEVAWWPTNALPPDTDPLPKMLGYATLANRRRQSSPTMSRAFHSSKK
jgi:8-oxo-dGTP pyrophosphatase MutT (NUDIX family)